MFHQIHEDLNAIVRDRIFPRGEQREVALEGQDVPRVNQRTALDAAIEQVFDFFQHVTGTANVASFELAIGGC